VVVDEVRRREDEDLAQVLGALGALIERAEAKG
jgi:hypothetical protein